MNSPRLEAIETEYRALLHSAGMLDQSDRGRLCVLGRDREKFLHGQVTHDVLRLKPGQGCYAALVNSKGRLQSDLFIYKLPDELLLDFETGLTGKIAERLQKYVIAEDVQIVDVAGAYGLLSIHGPEASERLRAALGSAPSELYSWIKTDDDWYLARSDRLGIPGFDLFVPADSFSAAAEKIGAARVTPAACDLVRIENAIPKFGLDMDDGNLAPEAGIGSRAISYSKGCYIGQEVIARIRTYGQVARALRLFRVDGSTPPPPQTKLRREGKEVGYITSSAVSPKYRSVIALGYARKEVNQIGAELEIDGGGAATIIAAPQ